jgi:hypothetical protein
MTCDARGADTRGRRLISGLGHHPKTLDERVRVMAE